MARPILNSAVTRPGAVLSWLGLLYSETASGHSLRKTVCIDTDACTLKSCEKEASTSLPLKE